MDLNVMKHHDSNFSSRLSHFEKEIAIKLWMSSSTSWSLPLRNSQSTFFKRFLPPWMKNVFSMQCNLHIWPKNLLNYQQAKPKPWQCFFLFPPIAVRSPVIIHNIINHFFSLNNLQQFCFIKFYLFSNNNNAMACTGGHHGAINNSDYIR